MRCLKTIGIYFLLACPLYGQMDSVQQINMVRGLAEFRKELLADSNNAIAFGVLSVEAKRFSESTNSSIIFNYMWPDLYFMDWDEKYPYRYSSYFQNTNIFSKNNVNVDQINNDNHYLRSAINYGFYERTYPFKIRKNKEIELEIDLFNIQKNYQILDYGPGLMCLAPILCSIYDSISIYQAITASGDGYIYSKNFISRFNSFKENSQIIVKKINHLTVPVFTGLYDLVIFNYPFQENNNLETVFKATRKALKPNGYMFIMKMHDCNKFTNPKMHTISTKQLLKALKKSGFIIEKRLDLNCKYVYKCKISDEIKN